MDHARGDSAGRNSLGFACRRDGGGCSLSTIGRIHALGHGACGVSGAALRPVHARSKSRATIDALGCPASRGRRTIFNTMGTQELISFMRKIKNLLIKVLGGTPPPEPWPPPQPKKTTTGPNLSYSKISTYLQCPLKYEFQVVKRMTSRPAGALTFGSVIHKVLEHLGQEMMKGTSSVSEEQALRLLDQHWESVGYESWEDEESYKARGRAAVKNFFTAFSPEPGSKIDGVEKFVEGVVSDCRLVGRVDRIDRLSNGKALCIDYKTGNKPVDPVGVRTDLQSNLYYILGEQYFGRQFDAFEYWYLETGQRVKVEIDERGRKDAERIVRRTARGIASKRFHAKKGVLCSWCDYRYRCPAWPADVKPLYREARESEDRLGLSYSKLSLFENCPFAYKKTYIDREPLRPKWFFAVGHSVHSAMEEYYRQDDGSLETLLRFLDDCWVSRGFETVDHEKDLRRQAEKWIRKYHARYAADGKFRRAHAVEEYFELPLGASGHVMIGFIDRIDKNDDGTYSLHDYKTDPKIRTQEEVDHDLQLTLYAWACRKIGLPLRDLTLIFMQFADHVSTSRTDAQLDAFEAETERRGAALLEAHQKSETASMAAAVALFAPKINKYCGGCDFLPVCPLRDEILTKHRHILMHQEEASKVAEMLEEGVDGSWVRSIRKKKK